MSHADAFHVAFTQCPLVAILRGITTAEAIAVCEALFDAGFRIAEVPLNSPEPFGTIMRLRDHFGDRMVIGAGTLVDVEDVARLSEASGQIGVAPNTDMKVIAACLDAGIVPIPGVATATEAFAAIAAGATVLKLFPASVGGAQFVAALGAVLPKGVQLLAVGGIATDAVEAYAAAGCAGFGVGSELYKPGRGTAAVAKVARRFVEAAARKRPVVSVLVEMSATIGESPIVDGDVVCWVDPVQSLLFSVCPTNKRVTRTALSEPISAIARRGEMLVGMAEHGCYSINAHSGKCAQIIDVPSVGPGARFNDWTVDSRGCWWAGTMHKALLAGRGTIVRGDASGGAAIVFDGLGVVNGMGFDKDETTLYVIDTLARTLLAFPADTLAGTLGEPRIVHDFLGLPGKPDGLAVSPGGAVWVAMWGGSSIVEVRADGVLGRSVALPVPHVSSLCFDPDTTSRVYVTTSRMRLSEPQLAAAPLSGSLFSVDLAG